MTDMTNAAVTIHHVGRFSASFPSSYRPASNEYSFGPATVCELISHEEEGGFNEYLARLQAHYRTEATHEAPSLREYVVHPIDDDLTRIRLVSLHVTHQGVIATSVSGSIDRLQSLRSWVAELAATYQSAPTSQGPREARFFMRRGWLRRPYLGHERASTSWQSYAQGTLADISITSASEAPSSHADEIDLADRLRTVEGVRVIRESIRLVANTPGREVLYEHHSQRSRTVFVYRHAPRQERPTCLIELSTETGSWRDCDLGQWESLLDSLSVSG